MLVAMHGVHGGGKSLLARILSEDYGWKLVVSDAAELFPEVVSFHPTTRQMVYTSSSLLSYSRALELARKGEIVVLDFGPRHSVPYVKWFLSDDKEAVRFFNEHIESGARFLESLVGKERIMNVFLVVKKDVGRVLERIRRRGREGFLREELDEEYLSFIDREMKRLVARLRDDGYNVLEVPADATLLEKLEMIIKTR